MTHHGQAFIRVVSLSHLSASCEAVSLARLVKAEIVSPYSGILINTGVVTQPLLGLPDYRQVQTATERTLDIHPLYKGTRLLFFPPVLNRILPPPQAQTPKV